MTREEAINWLDRLYMGANITDEYGDMVDMQPYEEAFNMAIKSLEQEPRKDEVILTKEEYGELVSNEFDNGYAKGYREALELEPCEYAPFTIDELEDEDTQKLFRGFKNQQVIDTDNDCSPSVTIIEPCDVPDINVGDMISRQAVLDYIHRIFNQGTGKKKSFKYIQKYVEKLPSVNPTKTGWIPVSERLPEENTNCLITVKKEDGSCVVEKSSLTDATYWVRFGRDINVIAWMPLPQPYAESEDRRSKDYRRATNGDMIKAMFPNAQIDYHEKSDLVDDYVTVFIKGCDTCQDYSYAWWNEPYKAESEE